jgi:hypothetical protein
MKLTAARIFEIYVIKILSRHVYWGPEKSFDEKTGTKKNL